MVKSRSAKANSATKMVFDQEVGFDPELSMYVFLKDSGYVNGSGVGYYLGDHTEYKFAQKNFKKKLAEDEGFRKVFQEVSFDALSKIINQPRMLEELDTSATDGITNMMAMKHSE